MSTSAFCSTEENTITVGIGEEFNSNVNERNNAKPDWTTKPYAKGAIKYEGPRVDLNGSIDASYNFYALGNRTDEFKGSAQLNTRTALIKDSLFMEANGNIQQVFKSIAQGQTNSIDSTNNQVNQGTVNGQLYMTPHVNDRTTLKAGYDFTAYIYGFGPGEANNTNSSSNRAVTNKTVNTVFANFSYETTPRLQLFLESNASRQDSKSGGYAKAYVNTGFRYQFTEDVFLQIKAGPQYAHFDNGDSTWSPYVDALAEQKFNRFFLRETVTSNYVENPSSKYSALKKSAGVSCGWLGDRSDIQLNATLSNTNGQQTSNSDQLSLSARLNYHFTERLSASLGASRESTVSSKSNQTRWYADGSMTYELGKNFSLQGYYNWKLSDSNLNNSDYTVNIVGLRLMKTF